MIISTQQTKRLNPACQPVAMPTDLATKDLSRAKRNTLASHPAYARACRKAVGCSSWGVATVSGSL
jgi:hypothetical protein